MIILFGKHTHIMTITNKGDVCVHIKRRGQWIPHKALYPQTFGRSVGFKFLRRLGLGLAVPQLEDIRNVIDFVQSPVEVRSCVTRRNAEASSGHENGHGGKANYDNRETTLQALARKGSNLGRVVEHDGHDRRVELA
jgi:hypothetical protein